MSDRVFVNNNGSVFAGRIGQVIATEGQLHTVRFEVPFHGVEQTEFMPHELEPFEGEDEL